MPFHYAVKKIKDFVVFRILHVDDTPHRIALGMGIGIFITFTPTLGFQMVLIVLTCTLLRANKLVGVPLAWLSNPFTLVPVYGPSFLLGQWLLGGGYSWSQFTGTVTSAFQCDGTWWERVCHWWNITWPILPPLLIGSIITGFIMAAAMYPLIYFGVKAYRRRFASRGGMKVARSSATIEAEK